MTMERRTLSIAVQALILVAAAALPAPAADCITRADTAQLLQGQGLRPVVLTDEQNARWRAYDAAHSKQPDAAGFTYVVGMGQTENAVLIGFDPQGCFAYYSPLPLGLVMEQVNGGEQGL